LLLIVFKRQNSGLALRLDPQACRMIVKQSLPLGISMGLIQVIYYLDTILLGFMRSDAEVGMYNAAYKIVLFVIMAGAFYFDAIFPVIAQYYKTSLGAIQKLLSYSARLVAILAIPMGIGGALLARPILHLFYGERYEHSAIALQILIWVAVLIYFNMIYARAMWACNQQKAYVKIVAGQALLSVILNLACIPWLGIAGAALSKVAAELLGLGFYYREFSKIVRVPFLPYLGRPLLASLPMILFLLAGQFFAALNIFILAVGGFIIYCITLCLCRGVTRQDALFLRDIFLRNAAK
jgi:O-antigen/teichoic acid export membrane protein